MNTDSSVTKTASIDELNQLAWEIRMTETNRAKELGEEALLLAEASGYTNGRAEALRMIGFCLVRLSRNEEAKSALDLALNLFESIDNRRGQATTYEYLGIIQRNRGKPAESLELLFRSLTLSQETGFLENEAANLYQLGVTFRSLGDYEKALNNLFDCIRVARTIEFDLIEGYALNVIGSIYFETAEYAEALTYFEQGLAIREKSHDQWGEAGSLDNIGSTFIKLGEWEKALDFCHRSLDINQVSGDKKGQANALLHLAEIHQGTNDLVSATEFCHNSLEIRKAIGDKKGEAEILLFLASMHFQEMKAMQADPWFDGLKKALEIAEETKAPDILSKTHAVISAKYKASAKYKQALAHLELHDHFERILHKDTINQKVLNMEITFRAEETRKEAEKLRLRNLELATLYKESEEQKEEIEKQKKNVEHTLAELKITQAQLIQSEKMASLGELTAGIAHEIQNPLNFVNNFSELNSELLADLKNGVDQGNIEEIRNIADNLELNTTKITYHGKRAETIIRGMLQHSRKGSGQKEPIDINSLAEEYLRLAYHGFLAKNSEFKAKLNTDFDQGIGKIDIIPQDIGRLLLNIYNNAFYAAPLPPKGGFKDPQIKHEPTVWVSTKKMDGSVLISVRDNGPGIPEKILDKIFQPFFTTKPTGQGTGLGLSLGYDIVKAHGGDMKASTEWGKGSTFVINLPLNQG